MILENAPIKEAIISLIFEDDNSIKFTDLEKIYNEFNEEYIKKTIFEENYSFLNKKINVTDKCPLGYRFISKKKKYFYQIETNKIEFHKLKPYINWKVFLNDFEYIFNKYHNLVDKNRKVIRMGLRYINEIVLPFPIARLEDYFNIYPKIPDKLPDTVRDFFLTIEIIDKNRELLGKLMQTIKQTDKEKIIFFLDINIEKNLMSHFEIQEIIKTFDILREYKNEIFFSCLTDKTMEFYK